jgi:FKBP-type peptidyl-prolyl cis-trans isomerase
MNTGEKCTLVLSSDFAYGPRGAGAEYVIIHYPINL